MKEKNIISRILRYVLGFFIMTLGIAISVKSNLGVSPVSSIPYTITCVIGLEMGKATILFHIALVFIQIIIMRKDFKVINLLQILVGVLFGYLTTFGNWLMSFVDLPNSMLIRVLMMLVSTFFIALGLFFYVPTNLMPLAGEGTMLCISEKFGFEFSNVKICFDVSMVAISLIMCLIVLNTMGSVGIGTVMAAFLVGIELRWIQKIVKRLKEQ